ncbi:30S ribosomal protein S17 [Candidatus Nomurabacteria bacterium RIFCSPHIGHO2_02_FULL_38_15]|uniref:Small ribosomal subunit protein uS17 n=1 Tax=Candidatus Nomurabacteria bacterium RIFCSPHIGHO2_02_FULL_38_15 TaxID=1801752 RepID=A0A1F6VR98_9BACT|nr:MAG: 30S ribosomal protein S17 [Candidatus Nomurabacteria bacterium RIFCSPHIGHO2_02_FULL_38_15]
MTTNRKILSGVVVSDKMNKTVVVAVTTFKKHPKYQKYFKTTKRYKAHDEVNNFKVGDKVKIISTKPMSKDKSFEVITN